MRRNAVLLPLAAVALLAVSARGARAQGFGVYEHDACAMARGGAVVADPCPGGSAIFFNPAGVVGSPNRWDVQLGATLIAINFKYRDSLSGQTTNATGNPVPVPQIYITRQLNDRWAVGFGVYAPYGLVVEWPSTFQGRFLAYRTSLNSLYFQPTAAFKANRWLKLGAGLTYARTGVDLSQAVDLSSQAASGTTTFGQLGIPAGTQFANAHIQGHGFSMAGHFGVIIEPTSKISIGARYLMSMTSTVRGSADFTQVGTGIILPPGNPIGVPGGTPLDSVVAPQFRTGGKLVTQPASGTIALPDQLVLGLAFKPSTTLTLTADYQWVHWTNFSQLSLSFQNLPVTTLYEDYSNTSGYRFGAEYRMNSMTLRGGWLRHEAAAPDQTVTPLLPEGARWEATGGIGFRINNRMSLDLAYQYIKQQDRRGRVVPTVRGPTGALANTGLYTGGANLFGASLHLAY